MIEKHVSKVKEAKPGLTSKSMKESATRFLRLVASGEVQEAYRLFVADDFIHHNTFFAGKRQSLLKAMEENAVDNPDKILQVHKIISEEDLVAVFSHIRQNTKDKGAAVVHIFRFDKGMIAELWDIAMGVPAKNINENGTF
jgi:predicted SnoaL-like aldol condensation-catalyzing enzyme